MRSLLALGIAALVVSFPAAVAFAQQAAPQPSVDETVKIYAAAWSEPDAARRREMLEKVWAPQGTYTDPQSNATGRDGLSEVIGRFLQQSPGARIVPTSHADVHHNLLRFTWKAVDRNGATIIEGIDFGVLASDGRLERIVGFFGPVKPL